MRLLTCCLAAAIAAGCGAGRSSVHLAPATRQTDAPPPDSLASYVEKTQALQARAPVQPLHAATTTLESFDADLGTALVEAQVHPSPATARRVAAAYARHDIFDMAHQYLMAAIKIDPRDGATYEALARLWRDVHMPQLAIGDAQRAVYYAPEWPVSHNTLGTVLQALGQRSAARKEYERALALDATAAYALNNLCYSDILDGHTASAIRRCSDALKVDPDLRAAQNNLGLAYAVAGKMNDALDAFNPTVDPAGALYNLGVVRMARKEYRSAVEAFQAAQASNPSFPLAAARAQQASAQISSGGER